MDQNIIYKFFEGNTSSEENTAIYNWLQESSENELILMRERKLFDAMIVSDGLEIEAKKPYSKIKRLKNNRFVLELTKVAAVVAITLIGAFIFKYLKQEELNPMTNIVSVPSGQRVNLRLSDGTEVWINAKTRVEYPTKFSNQSREVKVEGEAYFDVAHNKEIPFLVFANQFKIKVLGTKFDVVSYPDSNEFSTSLLEGSVEVSDQQKEQSVVLEVNQMVDLNDGELQKLSVTDFDQFSWREGLIRFKDLNFKDLMKRFEKCFDVKIVINNKNLENYLCSGTLRIADGLDSALNILQRDAKYTYKKSEDNTIVYIE